MRNIVFSDFYCIQCGNKAMSLPRKRSHQHKSMHLKKLYCPHCKITINCVECKNEEEIYDFKINYQNGEYQKALEESLELIYNEN